jgi:hypothetical protein
MKSLSRSWMVESTRISYSLTTATGSGIPKEW